MSSELLPGEDPVLLPGPDRVDRYAVAGLTGSFQPALQPELARR